MSAEFVAWLAGKCLYIEPVDAVFVTRMEFALPATTHAMVPA